MKFRPFFFWFHLIIGISAGLIILFLALTGLLLSFEPQILSLAEASLQKVPVAVANARQLSPDEIAQKAVAGRDGSKVSGLILYAEPGRSAAVQLGKDGTVYVDPYSGQVLGSGANGLRGFFDEITEMHRWFGFSGVARETAKMIKGIATSLFGLSVLTGLYLWWPKHWTWNVFKVIGIPQARFHGKQREFNWHNAIGFWSAPWLLIIIVTGLIMIYPWANDLLYRAFGSEPPPRPVYGEKGPGNKPNEIAKKTEGKDGEKMHRHGGKYGSMAGFNKFFREAVQQAPQWKSMTMRMPQGNRPNLMVAIEEPSAPNAYGRSMLTLDAKTGAFVKWDPYEAHSPGLKARIWVRALHTGEAGGWIGQLVAALACMGAMFLVWTGFSLSYRRFFN